MNAVAQTILDFWFGKDSDQPLQNQILWWKKDADFDRQIRENFEATLRQAIRGDLADWQEEVRSCLALTILLDQFSRNIYRDTPASFAQDPLALSVASQALRQNFDHQVSWIERTFFYLPLMHSEDLTVQQKCVELYARLIQEAPKDLSAALKNNYDFAVKHCEIIAKFGRFPHRNKILGRNSTPEELKFLELPGSSF